MTVPLLVLAAFVKLHGGWDIAVVGEIGFGFLLVAPMLIALYLDRAFARRVGGLGTTLIFASAYTTLEFLFGLTPIGTSLSIGVTQFDLLPFIQLASIAGIWGISFMVSWLLRR